MTTPDRYTQGNAQRRVDALRIGDRVDLEDDAIADPDKANGDHPEFMFEFQIVAEIERESDDCICLTFEGGFVCGFPPDHWLDVDGEQVR